MSLDPKIVLALQSAAQHATVDERLDLIFRADFEELMRSVTFRRWLMHVIDSPEWSGAGDSASELSTHPSADGYRVALETYRTIGAQDIGKRLLRRAMQVSRDQFRRMTAEAEDLFAIISGTAPGKE